MIQIELMSPRGGKGFCAAAVVLRRTAITFRVVADYRTIAETGRSQRSRCAGGPGLTDSRSPRRHPVRLQNRGPGRVLIRGNAFVGVEETADAISMINDASGRRAAWDLVGILERG